MAKKNKRHKIKKNPHAAGGVGSSIFALIDILLAAGLITWSYLEGGKAGIYLGAAGFMGAMICIIGLIQGIRSFHEEDRRHVFSVIGTFFNAAVLLGYMWVFSIGVLV